MNNGQMILRTPDKRLAAVCGLFCPACPLFIGNKEAPEKLKMFTKLFKRPIEELKCEGCRTDKRSFYCNENCKMTNCATKKGIDFCGECTDYPCEDLRMFQAEMPNRIELWKS